MGRWLAHVPVTGDGRRGLVGLSLSACGSGVIFGEPTVSASTGPDSLDGLPSPTRLHHSLCNYRSTTNSGQSQGAGSVSE